MAPKFSAPIYLLLVIWMDAFRIFWVVFFLLRNLIHNTSISLFLSLFFSLFPRGSGGGYRAAEWLYSQPFPYLRRLISLHLKVEQCMLEYRRIVTYGTEANSDNLYSALAALLNFSSPCLFLYSDFRGGFCTSAKVDGKQAHDKSLAFVRTLSFCCRDNVKG